MRRHRRGGERGGERGAVAVVTGLLMIVVVGLGAFTVDLGMAYASTRQLQTSADAGALAAANVLKGTAGACAAIRTAAESTAGSAADAIRAQNHVTSVRAGYATACTADGSLEVTYSARGTTPQFLGGLLGGSGDYTTTRAAKARLSVLSSGIIRPYAVCGSQLGEAPVGTVLQMDLPSTGNSACPGAASSGNWWSVDCPEVGSNSNAYMAAATLDGCTDPVSVVPNQLTTPARTPAGLRAYLEGSCGTRSASCLSANTGALNGTIIDSWDVLVAQQRRILLPVFCGGSPPSTAPCDTAAVVNAGGNNAVYPVHALVGVQICGYHFGNKQSPASPGLPGGECGSHNPGALSADPGSSQSNYILMRVVDVATLPDGATVGCRLGAPCDVQRTVSLVE